MTKGITAWRFYVNKFPNATIYDACALLNLMSTCSSLVGAYMASAVDKFEKRKKIKEWDDNAVAEWQQHVEDIAHPKLSMDDVLFQYFGIDRSTKKDRHFDPVEIKDTFGYDPRMKKLFKGKMHK